MYKLLVVTIGIYGCLNYISYKNVFFEDLVRNDKNQVVITLNEEDYVITYEGNEDKVTKIIVQYFEKKTLCMGNNKVCLTFDKNMFVVEAFENKMFRQILSKSNLLETNVNPASSAAGYVAWYDRKNLWGALGSEVKITLIPKEPLSKEQIKKYTSSFIIHKY